MVYVPFSDLKYYDDGNTIRLHSPHDTTVGVFDTNKGVSCDRRIAAEPAQSKARSHARLEGSKKSRQIDPIKNKPDAKFTSEGQMGLLPGPVHLTNRIELAALQWS